MGQARPHAGLSPGGAARRPGSASASRKLFVVHPLPAALRSVPMNACLDLECLLILQTEIMRLVFHSSCACLRLSFAID